MTIPPVPPPILATYRLQLHADFPLERARGLVEYLGRLGVTHMHASPILRARSGSRHGYDVVDPGTLNPELGGEADLEALVNALRAQAMGLVLDIVPNHMAASAENWRWEDVLTHGLASPYARWFDIEWRTGERELHSRVLLPVLGDYLGAVIERGELRVSLSDGALRLRYYEHAVPLDPSTYPAVLEPALEACDHDLGSSHPGTAELRAVLGLLRRLPRRRAGASKAGTRRRRQSGEALRRLRKLCALVPEVRRRIELAATQFGHGPGCAERLRHLLDAQAYRLVYWRRAAREINYRRFFDVNDLVALHMENPEVFAQTHALVLDWVRAGLVDGFRVDHPDGLLDPLGYFERLGRAAFPGLSPPPIFLEKILMRGERLRPEWPVAGSTGYDFLNQVEELFLDGGGLEQNDRDYRRIVRRPMSFAAVALAGKRHELESGLSAGVRRLAQRLQRLMLRGPAIPVLPLHEVAGAIVETIAHLAVYRTYLDDRTPEPAEPDRGLLVAALAGARTRGRASSRALALLEGALLASDPAMRTAELEGPRRRFVQRFQQLSGPAAAKGVEDTAFYVYVPLLSRDEVGGAPGAPVTRAAGDLHAANLHRADCWPHTMLTVTTHDTKRSADVRARLDVLSELPDEWEGCVYRWRRLNRRHRALVGGRRLPDANTEWLLYQTLVGAWPLELLPPEEAGVLDVDALAAFRERIAEYAQKAAREAKAHTSWVDPDPEFEGALDRFVERVLSIGAAGDFLAELTRFVRRIARAGLWNAVSRTVAQLASPGVPDIYQGDELWTFSLVDPDNRRPVDFDRRRTMLEDIAERFGDPDRRPALLRAMVEAPEDGRLKLHVTHRLLAARRADPALFVGGAYHPVAARGRHGGQVFAFGRRNGSGAALAIVPRLWARRLAPPAYLPPDAAAWGDTHVALPPALPRGRWTDALTGSSFLLDDAHVTVGPLLERLPVTLLLAESAHR